MTPERDLSAPRTASRTHRLHQDPFPPHVLREYALLADGERGAVVGPRGDICWMCAPGWDSDAVFCALIGGDSGYAVTPDERYVWGGHYEDASMIWRSRWITTSGIVECRDALAYPADPSRAVILRQVRAVQGPAALTVTLRPAAGFDRHPLADLRSHEGVWTARTGELHLRWTGAAGARRLQHGQQLVLHLNLAAGQVQDLVLEVNDGPLSDRPIDPEACWSATEAAWADNAPGLDSALARSDTRHSCAVLRGLTTRGGGMVAAVTTSLPERAETGRNYDYRYVWIRDQCYAGIAGSVAGVFPLLDDAVAFVSARLLEHGQMMAPAYRATGAAIPDQRRLGLPGYPGGYDLVGNWVNGQFQLDAFGEALQLFAAAARHDRLEREHWDAAEVAAAAIASRWQEPDAGIWEIDPRAWTHSRLTAAGGLRALAAARPHPPEAATWITLSDAIIADTSAHALHSDGYWQRAPDDAGLDGSLLLPGLRGALPVDDPRTVATLAAYLRDLTEDGYAYRFRHDDRPLADAEGSFLLCGFLTALALHQQDQPVEARAWFERTLGSTGPARLFSEEYDVTQRQMRGNLPQAFVHALEIEAAVRLARDA